MYTPHISHLSLHDTHDIVGNMTLTPDSEADMGDTVQSLAEHLTTSNRYRRLSPVCAKLSTSMKAAQSDAHALVNANATCISDHMRESDCLERRTAMGRRNLNDLSPGHNTSHLTDINRAHEFVALAAKHGASNEEQSLAHATETAVHRIKQTHSALAKIENAIRHGTVANEATVLCLVHMDAAFEEHPPQSAVEHALQQHYSRLRSMATEQLTSAWKEVIRVESTSETTLAVVIQRNVVLRTPQNLRLIARSPPPWDVPSAVFSLHDFCQALSKIGVLSDLLGDLQGRLMREVFKPMVKSANWAPVAEHGESADRLEMRLTDVQTPIRVVENVKTTLTFISAHVPSTLRGFCLDLQRSAFQVILRATLVPAIPPTSRGLSDWLQLLRQTATWEEELLGDENASQAIVGTFMQESAGQVWLEQRRNGNLQLARRMAYEAWGAWTSRIITESPPTPRVVTETSPAEDDGWGFDDGQLQSVDKSTDNSISQNDSGWGFDDVLEEHLIESTAAKPAKEAKRLAKRVGVKAQPQTPPEHMLPKATTPADLAYESPGLSSITLDTSYKVSVACDEAVRIAVSTLEEMEAVAALRDEPSFAVIPEGLSAQLVEALDLLRASIPVAQRSLLHDHLEIGLQLSNDYSYISKQLANTLVNTEWVKREEAVKSFYAASAIAFEDCVARQITLVLSILKDATFFSNDNEDERSFIEAEKCVRDIVSKVETVATGVSVSCFMCHCLMDLSVVSADRCQVFVGHVVESMAVQIISDIISLEDISERDSERIGSLLCHLEDLQHLFGRDANNVSTIASFVPHWIKFSYLNKIMGANLAEIAKLFHAGSLVDFAPNELASLVRALFADSPKRASILDEIEQ